MFASSLILEKNKNYIFLHAIVHHPPSGFSSATGIKSIMEENSSVSADYDYIDDPEQIITDDLNVPIDNVVCDDAERKFDKDEVTLNDPDIIFSNSRSSEHDSTIHRRAKRTMI